MNPPLGYWFRGLIFRVNGWVLPGGLVRLLVTGRWRVPADPDWLRRHVPDTDADDVEFLGLAGMRLETAAAVASAAEGEASYLPDRSSRALGHAVALPLLDWDHAVCIAAQRSDSALALDYRASAVEPVVVETHWGRGGGGWRVVAPTFAIFARRCGL